MRSINGAFIWLTIGAGAALLLPVLAMDGMFMDGMLYSAVAHNQAIGYGSFWFPRFSSSGLAGLATFHEHPPLAFGLQAIWFRIFGSAFWVERAYALFTVLATGGLVVAIWRVCTTGRPALRRLAWLPLLLWLIIPTVHWCYHNNMLENTMGMFTTAAALFAIRARHGRYWALHLLAGSMVFLATMSKGLPGFYPLAAPVLIALAYGEHPWRSIMASAVMTMAVAACYGILLLDPDARAALGIHVDQRLLHRIAEVPTVDHRFASLEMLFTNMLGPIIISLLIVLVIGRRSREVVSNMDRPAIAMALIGISGVLPLMLTMVQKSFYMATALPFLAISLALWASPVVAYALEGAIPKPRLGRAVRWTGIIATAGAFLAAIVLFGKPSRDADILHDVSAIGMVVPRGSVIMVPEEMWNDWNLQGYLIRHHLISLTTGVKGDLILTRSDGLPWEPGFSEVALETRQFKLWQRRNSPLE